jgi:hypothetical protein
VPKLGLTLAAVGSLLMVPGEPRLLWLGGAGVRLQGDLARHLGFSTDFSYHHGSAETTLGSVTSDLLSLQAAAHLHHQLPALTLRSGLGARFGAARLAGQPTDALTVRSDAAMGRVGGAAGVFGADDAAGSRAAGGTGRDRLYRGTGGGQGGGRARRRPEWALAGH